MTAVFITFGRLRFGGDYAFQTRYTTFTIYLVVAIVYLIPITLSSNQSPVGRYSSYFSLGKLAPILAVILLLAQLPNYFKEVRYANVLRLTLLQGKACLLYGNVVREECSTPLYPLKDPLKDPSLQTRANMLDQLGFLRPRLVRNAQNSWKSTPLQLPMGPLCNWNKSGPMSTLLQAGPCCRSEVSRQP